MKSRFYLIAMITNSLQTTSYLPFSCTTSMHVVYGTEIYRTANSGNQVAEIGLN